MVPLLGLGGGQIERGLEVEPQPRRGSEIGGQPQGGVGGDRPLAGDDVRHTALGDVQARASADTDTPISANSSTRNSPG